MGWYGFDESVKKSVYDPTQHMEFLGVEMLTSVLRGLWIVPDRKALRIETEARKLLGWATRNKMWLPGRWLNSYTCFVRSLRLP